MPLFLSAALLAVAIPEPDARLEALLTLSARAATPGCAIDVRRGGVPIVQSEGGLANMETGTRITSDTVFEAGSVSKQFIGAGIALLHVRGRLSLSDSVRRWLPELPERFQSITLRMMLNHTSGLRNWNNLAELTGRGEDASGYDNGWVLAAAARQSALNNTPGTEYLYSNTNFVLAALVIERASGQRLNDFFRDAFFGPLGMAHSRWRDDPTEVVPGRGQAYSPRSGGGWSLDVQLNGVVGAGGLMTTVDDLQRWNDALSSPREQDRQWVALMIEPGRLSDGTPFPYGFGLELDPIAGRPAIAHAGATGAYRAWLSRSPEDRLSVALLCNDGSLNTQDLGPRIVALYLPVSATSQPTATIAAPGLASSAPAVAGRWRNMLNDTAVDVTVGDGLVRFNGGAPFRAISADTLVGPDGKRRAALTSDAHGRVTDILLDRVANAPLPLHREQAWTPDGQSLAAFTGRYFSEDVDGQQRIARVGNTLSWIDPTGAPQPLEPIYRDTFAAPQSNWTLRFRRDRRGAVTGFDASITRARRISFRLRHALGGGPKRTERGEQCNRP